MTAETVTILATVPTLAHEIEVACFPANASLRAVAVQGAVEDWAAYADLATCSDQEIAERGIKLAPLAAEHLFPDLSGKYRR